MDISSLVSRADIEKEVEKNKKGGGEMVDSRFWRIPDGKSTIRLLPRLEARVPWKTVYSHRYNERDNGYLVSSVNDQYGSDENRW